MIMPELRVWGVMFGGGLAIALLLIALTGVLLKLAGLT